MSVHPSINELAERINACAVCRWLGVTANAGDGFGVLVEQRGHAVGIWSTRADELVFRNMAKWEVVHCATLTSEAYELTLSMAEGNRWTA